MGDHATNGCRFLTLAATAQTGHLTLDRTGLCIFTDIEVARERLEARRPPLSTALTRWQGGTPKSVVGEPPPSRLPQTASPMRRTASRIVNSSQPRVESCRLGNRFPRP